MPPDVAEADAPVPVAEPSVGDAEPRVADAETSLPVGDWLAWSVVPVAGAEPLPDPVLVGLDPLAVGDVGPEYVFEPSVLSPPVGRPVAEPSVPVAVGVLSLSSVRVGRRSVPVGEDPLAVSEPEGTSIGRRILDEIGSPSEPVRVGRGMPRAFEREGPDGRSVAVGEVFEPVSVTSDTTPLSSLLNLEMALDRPLGTSDTSDPASRVMEGMSLPVGETGLESSSSVADAGPLSLGLPVGLPDGV